MATYAAGRALLLRGPNVGKNLNGGMIWNCLSRNVSTTVFQPPKPGQQTKLTSEAIERNLSAAPGVALDPEHEEEMGIKIKTQVPGEKNYTLVYVRIGCIITYYLISFL